MQMDWVERMFPEPVDHGIAQPDRAVCNVSSGTDTAESNEWGNERWYEGGGRVGERAHREIVIYPPTGGVATQGAAFEPVKIGVLVDMDIGQLLADWLDPTSLAIEDAMNEGGAQSPPPPPLAGCPAAAANDDAPTLVPPHPQAGHPTHLLGYRPDPESAAHECRSAPLAPMISDT